MSAELPLTKDPTARHVPWTIGLMMYLGSLAAFFFIIGFHFFGSWEHDLITHMTIEIPTQDMSSQMISPETLNNITNQTIHILRQTPGIKDISILNQKNSQDLLSPWLGNDPLTYKDLPLPILIDLKKDPTKTLNLSLLESSLKTVFPLIRIIDHKSQFSSVALLGFSVEIFILIVMGILFTTATLTLSFAARTSLLIHKNIIDILSLLGATDLYIAKEFRKSAQNLAIKGAGMSYALLFITGLIGFFIFKDLDVFSTSLLFLDQMSTDVWFVLAIPLLMGVFMIFSARISVEKLLRRL